MSIADALRKAQAVADESCVVRKMATDEQVEDVLLRLGRLGYKPSEQIVEPVRAFISGYGVLLSGNAGVGKTFLMKCLAPRGKNFVRPVSRIMEYGLQGLHIWYDWTDGKDICIDDLGAETTLSEYGNKDELIARVITHRAERQDGRTSITTNLNSKQISERYGDRTLSRLRGMCKTFHMDGQSHRKAEPKGQ